MPKGKQGFQIGNTLNPMKTEKKQIVKAKITIGAYGSTPGLINDGVVERIIEPPEGGRFIKFIGCSYLYKGTTDLNIVDILAFPKRRFRNFFTFITRHKIFLIFLLSKKIRIALCESYLGDVYIGPLTKNLMMSPKRYCKSVRELWRVITLFINKEKDERTQSILFKLRNIVLLVLEYDMAYRFMLQDILPKIKKEQLKQNTKKELSRVLDIFCERSKGDGRFKQLKKGLLLLHIPKIKKLVLSFLLKLDFDETKLDGADWYFCLQRHGYSFRGIELEERIKQKKTIDKQKHHFIPEITVLNQRK